MKVEELKKFGGKFQLTKETVKVHSKIIREAFRNKFGFWGMLRIFIDTYFIQMRLKRDNPQTHKKALAISKNIFIFTGMFLALAKRLGRVESYEFLKTNILNQVAKTSMASLYQLDDLKKCEGDVFENFKKMNIAMFKRTTKDGTWLMTSYQNEKDKLTMRVTTCTSVEIFNELNVPELGKFGCDHDIVGYPVIEKEVNCEFRRLCTIANGDDHCEFEFFRRGTAPNNAHMNV